MQVVHAVGPEEAGAADEDACGVPLVEDAAGPEDEDGVSCALEGAAQEEDTATLSAVLPGGRLLLDRLAALLDPLAALLEGAPTPEPGALLGPDAPARDDDDAPWDDDARDVEAPAEEDSGPEGPVGLPSRAAPDPPARRDRQVPAAPLLGLRVSHWLKDSQSSSELHGMLGRHPGRAMATARVRPSGASGRWLRKRGVECDTGGVCMA
jgi:hypothetical protein